ncbi:Elongation of very long chain fatty acids protein [Frankliniella fusca]|uniref:Elongation of very long chain fatty acids protein n=1 Tax=Frankliniella fusca TaxID=407009 RepID=A0AAE1HZG1_9NEOP|nr:Elongation of very long chain fatty acids protein [Frankliniella fusca]
MAQMWKVFSEGAAYCWNGFWTYTDPRVENLPLMRSPFPMLTILAAYLYFVLSLGPRFMKHRKPYNLDKVMIVYNAVQVIWCCWLAKLGLELVWLGEYSYTCQPLTWDMTQREYDYAFVVWCYFVLKIVDLLDTVFMVLRKNNRQITFLHLYHHTNMVWGSWIGTKFHPGGHHTFFGATNTIVHCLLYSYYLISLFEPRVKGAWWKKYVTLSQIVQFGLNAVHGIIPFLIPGCNVNKLIGGALLAQNMYMFALFGDFYYKNYVRKGATRSQDKDS